MDFCRLTRVWQLEQGLGRALIENRGTITGGQGRGGVGPEGAESLSQEKAAQAFEQIEQLTDKIASPRCLH
jgi:hypothetical protein